VRRTAVSAVVVVLHLAGAFLLMHRGTHRPQETTDDSHSLVWLVIPEEMPPSTEAAPQARIAEHGHKSATDPPSSIVSPGAADSGRLRSRADWAAAAARAATRAAAGDSASVATREPRRTRPFGWDKSRTERWSFPDSGGTAIRLSERCQLVLNPLPVGGCSLGRIVPRGDLFDGMDDPVGWGDWKD
jgi:hypothetical protein